jgi:hypothetical protein
MAGRLFIMELRDWTHEEAADALAGVPFDDRKPNPSAPKPCAGTNDPNLPACTDAVF